MINCVSITPLTEELERRIQRNPLLNMDTFIIPSPYIQNNQLKKDRDYSYVWMEEGEILGVMLVYSDRKKNQFLIYKQATSPFGRGRGIGTTLIEHLSRVIPVDSVIYLYVWEKQSDTLDFFHNKGFKSGEPLVYRNLVYHYLYAAKEDIKLRQAMNKEGRAKKDDIGKTRHDARKTLKLLSHMVDMLSAENGDRIIEDINRETTTFINTLNSFRDTMQIDHTVNLKDIILERIIPYIETSSVPCELNLHLSRHRAIVRGYYVFIGRALINLISNALDAILENGKPGKIWITLSGAEGKIFLKLRDNGVGISPEKLKLDEKGIPAFVGRTTKASGGEGIGTQQIYSTFDPQHIHIESRLGEYTTWTIEFDEVQPGQDKRMRQMERLYHEFFNLLELQPLDSHTSRTEAISFIWQLRKMELFMFDLVFLYSKYHNIRMVYRGILSYLQGNTNQQEMSRQLDSYQIENSRINLWLKNVVIEIKRRTELMKGVLDLSKYQGPLFKSYGQSNNNVIIFTMDPDSGDFLATDRKLAEHLDFAPYLKNEKDLLLRGEFTGDMNNDEKPICFGVWSIESQEDLISKLKLIRKGAAKLVEKGIHKSKKLAFYQTTFIRYSHDIDTDASSTFGEFSLLSDKELERFTRLADDEFNNFMAAMD